MYNFGAVRTTNSTNLTNVSHQFVKFVLHLAAIRKSAVFV